MRVFFFILAALLMAAAWLSPVHRMPWTTFSSEILTFAAALSLCMCFAKQAPKIAKPQLIAAGFIFVPLIQWAAGLIIYFSTALLSSAYLLMFWLMVVVGYNLASTQQAREGVFTRFSLLVLVVAVLSGFIAVLQWLNLTSYFPGLVNVLKGNRPYANFAQPNNLATFLSLGVFACLYLFEQRVLAKRILVPTALLLIFAIALTQSRTSWVVGLFVPIYWFIKHYWGVKSYQRNHRIGFAWLLLWIGIFVADIALLPTFNAWIAALSQQSPIETINVVDRASSGYLRFDMWAQASIALGQQPWFGYGWNQTSMAQIAAFDIYPSHEWYKSAHNMIFDLLLWNGLLIGTLLVGYFFCWLYWLNKGAKENVSIIAGLMIAAILIHAMLEYPIHYAYFLLPMGFLLGLIQSQYPRLPSVKLPVIFIHLTVLAGVVLGTIMVRDFELYKTQSYLATQKSLSVEDQQDMQKNIWVLTQFKERVWWIGLAPYTQVTDAQMAEIGRMVSNTASRYDLHKYAQLLAFNGKRSEAEHQLWIIQQLHGKTYQYEELVSAAKAN